MRTRRLGHSGLDVSVLGLGTMTWGETTDEHEARDMLKRFLNVGGSLIDTAASYGNGASESLIGTLIGQGTLRDDVVLATKAGLGGRHRSRDASRGALLSSLDASLRRLQTDYVDLWQVHIFDDNTPLEETLQALQWAVAQGKVRYIGVSNYTGWQLVWAQQLCREGVPVISNQVEYSLLNREPEHELVDAAKAMDVSLLSWSPLGRGVLTGKYRYDAPADSRARAGSAWASFVSPYLTPGGEAIVEGVAKAAEGLDLTLSDVAIAWLLSKPHIASALIGPRTADQLSVLLEAADLTLPDAIVSALDDVSAGGP